MTTFFLAHDYHMRDMCSSVNLSTEMGDDYSMLVDQDRNRFLAYYFCSRHNLPAISLLCLICVFLFHMNKNVLHNTFRHTYSGDR